MGQCFRELLWNAARARRAGLSAGHDVLFDIDWQGGAQLRQTAPDDVVCVFILPPSAQALRERLLSRALDSPEVIEKRLSAAGHEVGAWRDYTLCHRQ